MSQSPPEAIPTAPAGSATAQTLARSRSDIRALPFLRAVPALLAVACAGLAEHLAADARTQGLSAPPTLSWLLFGLAAVLFLPAVWPVPALRPAAPPALDATWQAFRRRPLVGGLLGAAILCGLAAIPLFTTINAHFGGTPPDEPANTGAWLLWIAALLLFGGAAVAWERGAPVSVEGTAADPPGDRLTPRVEWAILLGLLVFALLLRLPNLENDPPGLWFDEAQNGLVAGQLLAPGAAHPTFVGGFTQMGSLYFYVLAWVLKLFGGTIWPLRLLPALAGAAIAPLLYLLGARLYGWRVGLAAGGLVAVSAWNITFSRFGIASLPTVSLDVAVFVCALQGLRTGRLGYFAGAGVLLGLAMQMYYVARLAPLILAALLIHLLITQRMRLVRVARLGVVAFALGAALGFLPVGLFALQQPAAFGGRVDTVSIFNPQVNGGNLNAALSDNLSKHLLMFNFKGDGNGRHNLSDAPQLDDLTAALFILGLGTCILRAWRWQYFFPVVWFAAALAGGVLSLPFEAPQSHRTLENSVVTALLAGIVLGELWGALAGRRRQPAAEDAPENAGARTRPSARFAFGRAQAKAQTTLPTRRSVRPAPQSIVAEAPAPAIVPVSTRVHDEPRNRRLLRLGVSALGVLAGVAWVASLTLPRYFVTQAQARGIWEDMNAPQAQAAQTLRRSAGQYRVYVSPGYLDTPAQHYLAADVPVTTWPGMEALPFDSTDNRDVIIILDPPLAGDISYIARMYPQATFEALRTPTGEGPLMWTIRVPASDIAGIHGVRAQLFDPGSATPRTDQTLPGATFDWQSAGGHAGTLRLATTLHIDQYGMYRFNWLPAGGAQVGGLLVDGYPVAPGGSLPLAIGLHSIVATDTVGSATGTAQLQWTPPGGTPAPIPATNLFDPRRIEPHGLTGIYRQGTDPTGPTANERVDAVISFFFHTPALGLGRPYSVEWSGRLYVPQTGSYKIGTEQITNSRLQVDGRELIVNTQPNNYQETELSLTAGWHDIQLNYVDAEPYAHIYLYWTPPGMGRSLIPAIFLWPQMGQYPAVPESGGWPTLADADGSVLPNGRPATGGPAPGPGLATPSPAAAVPTSPPAPPAAGPSPAPGTPLNPRLVLGNGDTPLAEPRGAAADAAGNLYIYTNGDSKVHAFSPDGKPLRVWDVRDQAGKPLVEGSALLVQGDTLWVLNAAASDLLGYSLSGQPVAPVHLCACFSPRGIALARDGSFWVADTGNNRVVQVAATGGILHTLGSKGNAPGQFAEPASVWQAADGTLYVADIGNSRVQSFGADGTPLAQWPVGPSIARDGNRLAGDSAGAVLVTEAASQTVVRYDAHGKELGRWTYAPQGATLVPAAGLAPVGPDSFLVLFLQANLAAVFRP